MTTVITIRNGSITVKVREDQQTSSSKDFDRNQRRKPELIEGYVLKGWEPKE